MNFKTYDIHSHSGKQRHNIFEQGGEFKKVSLSQYPYEIENAELLEAVKIYDKEKNTTFNAFNDIVNIFSSKKITKKEIIR